MNRVITIGWEGDDFAEGCRTILFEEPNGMRLAFKVYYNKAKAYVFHGRGRQGKANLTEVSLMYSEEFEKALIAIASFKI